MEFIVLSHDPKPPKSTVWIWVTILVGSLLVVLCR